MPNSDYPLDDFLWRSRTAVQFASDRVQAKYGMPCGMALRQLAQMETAAAYYANLPHSAVRFIEFIEQQIEPKSI